MSKACGFAVICERVLQETDGMMSAMRIADLFTYQPVPGITPEQTTVPISALISIRLLEDDELEHSLRMVLIRPDGEETALGNLIRAKIQRAPTGAPGGFNVNVRLGVTPKQLGLHQIVAFFDDVEFARAIFTLVQAADTADSQTTPTSKELLAPN